MKSFLFFSRNNNQSPRKKIFILIFLLIFSAALFKPVPVQAQNVDFIAQVQRELTKVRDYIKDKLWAAVKKAGSIAFQRTLATSLNKIAYDAANYIGAGNEGQKSLFRFDDLGTYMLKTADEAGGKFLETFVRNLGDSKSATSTCETKLTNCYNDCYQAFYNQTSRLNVGSADILYKMGEKKLSPTSEDLLAWKAELSNYPGLTDYDLNCTNMCDKANTGCAATVESGWGAKDTGTNVSSFNVCQPSSIEVKLKISLGLVAQSRPTGPNCTFFEVINNWGDDINKKLASIQDPNYIDILSGIFNPQANDIGIYFLARSDISSQTKLEVETKKDETLASGGWIDARDIAGALKGVPDAARKAEEEARAIRIQNFGKTTEDILVDASNIFLNQLAISTYNNILRKISDRGKEVNFSLTNPDVDPNALSQETGESRMREKTKNILNTQFENNREMDILSDLAICVNPNNPGPNNCVIDDRFMQAIIEQKTVGQAVIDGNLNPNWKIEKEVFASAHKIHYSLRNVKILRKHRILPLAWEVAIERAFANLESPVYVTLGDLVACFDPTDPTYDKYFSDKFNGDTSWCEGLVDPNWVLKAPLGYCQKSGSGSYVENTIYIEGFSTSGFNTDGQLILSRSDDYCADNQTCIKENASGGCAAYGYCTEDRRTWNLDSSSCSPLSNTCQTFTNVANGTVASYLENTLDYSECSVDSIGCNRYSLSGLYNANGSITWNFSDSLFFDKDLQACSAKNEGCSQLMRVKPGAGFNLIANSSLGSFAFGNNINYWDNYSGSNNVSSEIINTRSEAPDNNYGDGLAVKVSGYVNAGFESTDLTFPKDLQIIAKQNYTLSADILLSSGDRVEMRLDPDNRNLVTIVNQNNVWQKVSLTTNSSSGFSAPYLSFVAYSSDATNPIIFYVKNIKLELSDRATTYNSYGTNKVYQKLLPNYLASVCYADVSSATKNYSLKAGAPAICNTYIRQCNADEAGCELFTSVTNNFSVPAQINTADKCPGECVGYDMYIAQENYFNSQEVQNLIPTQATKCAQTAVGCNEFTNLDAVAMGGEGKEYYSELKQCIKPDDTKCDTFYTWEGSASGYNIQTYKLQKDSEGNPLVNFGNADGADCSDIYDLPISDPRYNPDCLAFRNNTGQISYRLASRVITCSENCFNYRLSANNIDQTIRTAAECVGADKNWNSLNNTCNVCLNGGLWDNNQGACVYKAIPNEGKSCRAVENNCREYSGNQGSNTRLIATYNFDGNLDAWYSNCSDGISVSQVSNIQNGGSLFYNSAATSCSDDGVAKSIIKKIMAGDEQVAKVALGSVIKAGNAYTLQFLARSQSDNEVKIYFQNEDSNEKYFFNSLTENSVVIKGGNEWRIYNVNLDNVIATLGDSGTLNISADNDLYLDSIILKEITNRYYFIKDSIKVPDSCYYDALGEYQGDDYNLGCSQYKDRDNWTHNLHNFSKLCSSSSVGCEQMISTNNYNSAQSGIWGDANNDGVCDSDEEGCIFVERDTAIYATYDRTKTCLVEDLGCSRLGEGLGSGLDISWSDVFKLNDPNKYSNIMCSEGDLGCAEYQSGTGVSYFKNPVNNLCVYRTSTNPEVSGKDWYKVPVKRCDSSVGEIGVIDGLEKSGPVCTKNSDCASNACIVDNNDYYCSVSYLKTIGYGGLGSAIPVPDESVALCEAVESGCTEYIDPISSFNPNLIKNANFSNSGESWGVDTWNNSLIEGNEQVINFDRNKLYSFRKTNNSDGTSAEIASLSFNSPVRVLQQDNNFSSPISEIELNSEQFADYIIFNSLENENGLLAGGEINKTIEVRELVVSYNLKADVDATSCSGLVDTEAGCVLFNERSIAGKSGFSTNNYNAIATLNKQSPVTSYGPYVANTLLKAKQDRTCAKWLSCTSYVVEDGKNVCTSVAECNLLDSYNQCANYIIRPTSEKLVFDIEKNRNATGYALLDSYYFNNIKEVGFNTKARYNFEEIIPSLSCFVSNGSGYPTDVVCSFDKNIIKDSIVKNPTKEAASYSLEGKTYLKVAPGRAISPQAAGSYVLLPTAGEYYLTYLVNTKNSNTAAKVTVINVDTNQAIAQFTSTAATNWKREIKKLAVSGETKIRIYLSANRVSGAGAVYFDDVNIETVLQLSDDEYAARDCRLYPSSSSLNCQEVENTSQNTITRNGLEGYCLEYDLANPGVCQLWMPIDRISAAKITSTQLGYSGKQPLTYCAEVDSNFMLLEKRKGVIIEETIERDNDFLYTRECYYPTSDPDKIGSYCMENFAEALKIRASNTQWMQVTDESEKELTVSYIGGTKYSGYERTKTLVVTDRIEDPSPGTDAGNNVNYYCGSNDYFLLVTKDLATEFGWLRRDDVAVNMLCLPLMDDNHIRYVPSDMKVLEPASGINKINPKTDGWYQADGFHVSEVGKGINEVLNDQDPIRFLDLNVPIPNHENSLKKIFSQNNDEVFRLTCNKFIEVVSGSGENMAWADRVASSTYQIQPSTTVIYNNYVRKLGDIPFGAASWPDDFSLINSPRVPLYNQYSAKNNEDVFAGRPYGCDADSDSDVDNCLNIGYCSYNPDVYCLLDSNNILKKDVYDISQHSCGSWGSCQPLWKKNGGVPYEQVGQVLNDPANALRQLFLQAPVAYEFGDGGYVSTSGYYKSSTITGVPPEVNNVYLYSSASPLSIVGRSGINMGVYRLDFNISIDANQQPLREIVIDWGDGFKQVITGEDAREEGSVHSFFHYYSDNRSVDNTIIRIKAYDNWGEVSSETVNTF